MSFRTALLALTMTALVAAGCGDDSEGAAFADISLYDLEGEPAVVTHDGRPLVINFFAESCAPCVAEMPAFESVFQRVSARVDFVGISEDATAAAGRRIVEATGITYPSVWDADGTAFAQFEAFGMPTTVFVTATGSVADVHTGALSEDTLATMIDELIDER